MGAEAALALRTGGVRRSAEDTGAGRKSRGAQQGGREYRRAGAELWARQGCRTLGW